jgi:hypothetical protein
MKCNACNNEVQYNVESKSYPPICNDCTKLTIDERQKQMLKHALTQKYITGWSKYGSVDIQPLEVKNGVLIGYKLSCCMPDTRKKWVAEPDEEGTKFKAYLLRE